MTATIVRTVLAAVVAALVSALAATDGAGAAQFTIFQITTTTLPDAEPGQPYSALLNSVLGVPPLSWGIAGGCDDPALLGLTLDTPSTSTSTVLRGRVPANARSGVVVFCIFASDATNSTPIQTISMRVRNTQVPQAPEAVEVVHVEGRRVTVRWRPPTEGPVPVTYRLEGGPASDVMVAGLTVVEPFATFELPRGQWYLRASTTTALGTSAPSPATRVSLETSAFPPAPRGLAASVSGQRVALSWTPSFGAGALEGAVLDVSGARSGLLGVPSTEGWIIDNVAAGTYSVAVRGRNGAGTGAASAPIVVGVPGGCSGPPQAPERPLAAFRDGVVHLMWEPPAGGPAVEDYIVTVTGSTFGAFPVGLRRVHTVTVAPGTYTVTVAASNVCGTGPATTDVTVVVP